MAAYHRRLAALAELDAHMKSRPGMTLRLHKVEVGRAVYTAQLDRRARGLS